MVLFWNHYIVLVTDEELRHAVKWLWFEHAIGAEFSGIEAIAAILSGKIDYQGSAHTGTVKLSSVYRGGLLSS